MWTLLLLLGLSLSHPLEDMVMQLPDCPKYDFDIYSGYLPVKHDETQEAKKHLHYMLYEAKENPEDAPLLIWLNGGPGCSSLLGNFMELGACVMDDGEYNLHDNPHAWNDKQNVLFIESPAGVGYSYATSPDEYIFDDNQSSLDNFAALMSFYEKFPEYRSKDLWITGESYGGIYVPYFAYRVDEFNKLAKSTGEEKINIQGIAIVNPAVNWEFDTTPSYLPMAYMHNLMSSEIWHTLRDDQCEYYFLDVLPAKSTPACDAAKKQFEKDTSRINWYDIYRPLYDYDDQNKIGVSVVGGQKKVYERGVSTHEYTPWMKGFSDSPLFLADNMEDYLNREDVRRALNIPDELPAFEGCTQNPQWTYNLQKEGSWWIFDILQESNIDVLVMSGDTDGACPTYGTERWINALEREVVSDWHTWLVGKQVGGYTKTWEGIKLTTLHGVGHMAPQWARPEAHNIINEFVHE